MRKQATEVHCRATAPEGDETLFPGKKFYEVAYISQVKVMVPARGLIPKLGNMFPYMMDFTYTIKLRILRWKDYLELELER